MTAIANASNAPERQDIEIYRGATFTLPFAIVGSAGVAIDITGWVISASLRRSRLGALVASFDVVVENYPQGKFYLEMSAANTALIKCGELPSESASRYWWDVRLQKPDGRIAYARHGEALVWSQVTHP